MDHSKTENSSAASEEKIQVKIEANNIEKSKVSGIEIGIGSIEIGTLIIEHPNPNPKPNENMKMPAMQTRTLLIFVSNENSNFPRNPKDINPQIPDSLQEICMKCLAKKPEERYATAQELANALQNFWMSLLK